MNKTESITADTPHYGTVQTWLKMSGMRRTRTYQLIGEGIIPTRKVAGRTLIDIRSGLAWIASQPPAQVRMTRKAA